MAEEGFKRKLTAILSADVEGYSRLMVDDEEATVRTLKSYRKVLTTLIQQKNGIVLDSPGDNLLAEFISVVDAVQCAVAIQKEIHARNEELPESRRMQFRIGINLGDVIQEEGRIYGDGVNIAARLESLAEPGGICISKTAFDHIESKLPYVYDFIGEQTLKNIAKPVGAYRVLLDPRITVSGKPLDKGLSNKRRLPILIGKAAVLLLAIVVGLWQFYMRRSSVEPVSVDKMAYPLPDKPSIAVMPFDNMSKYPEQEYLADGLSEEIITALSSVPKLFVIARNSSFSYKGKPVKVQQISRELGVRYVLEGSVRKDEDRVRITAQLIDALNGHHLWAESYDRKLGDIFVLQDEITMKIITQLQIELTDEERTRLGTPCSGNLKAYLKYLQAEHLYQHANIQNIEIAQRLAEEAVALDPEYACAYSFLGAMHIEKVRLGSATSPKESMATAYKMINKAISLNPSISGPHATLSLMYRTMGQYEKAIAESEKALSLNYSSPIPNIAMGNALRSDGRADEGLPFLKQAIRLDPFNPNWLSTIGLSYILTGQYEEGISACKKSEDLSSENIYAQLCLAIAYSASDHEELARTAAANVLRINPRFSSEYFLKTQKLKKQEDNELIINALRKAGLN